MHTILKSCCRVMPLTMTTYLICMVAGGVCMKYCTPKALCFEGGKNERVKRRTRGRGASMMAQFPTVTAASILLRSRRNANQSGHLKVKYYWAFRCICQCLLFTTVSAPPQGEIQRGLAWLGDDRRKPLLSRGCCLLLLVVTRSYGG